ncbi:MAG TPA: hypothetical protein VGC41_21080 [Kofleriaceae bacterium]
MASARPLDLTRVVRDRVTSVADDTRYQISMAIEPHPMLVTIVEDDLRRVLDLLIENSRDAGQILFAVYSTEDYRRVRLELAGRLPVSEEVRRIVTQWGGTYTADRMTTTIELPRSR